MRAGRRDMEGIRLSCVLSCYYSSKTHFRLHHQPFEYAFMSLPLPPKRRYPANPRIRSSLPTLALQDQDQQSFHKSKEMLPKIDKSGRFCSPRAARELALYAFLLFFLASLYILIHFIFPISLNSIFG